MTLKSNIWRAIMAARMQFVFYLREKKGAVMPRGGHFIPCSDIFNGGACRTPGRSLSHVLFTTADGHVHRSVAAPRSFQSSESSLFWRTVVSHRNTMAAAESPHAFP